ncbi:M20/M25/M40 family metallo-hydrolase [Segetibacter sp. 3557_3]|uniref:M20/M25/M40 family metallo-hydrolase n=1 Tax=Segetibacter sp. 3557_3 TaxID=2547429 RepID=UPI0010589271|nr:M20/M25/M40 family metallo-hydrolase [Segetibacter sp. 3557_3]TDH26099.1 M20/M25/M40 family metallo-hydrolase [Segetibacter sp. 3557_3]
MIKRLIFPAFLLVAVTGFSQQINQVINLKEVERIEKTLSSDDMQGRRTGTPGIDKAAAFISNEFKAAGLNSYTGQKDYFQHFTMVRPVPNGGAAIVNGKAVDLSQVVVVTSQPELKINDKSGYEVAYIKAGDNLFVQASALVQAGKNTIIIVDTSFRRLFSRLTFLKRQLFKSDKSQVFLLSAGKPETFSIESKHTVTEMPLTNVVGVLPGKTRAGEFVVFSGHYDHLGIGKPENGDSIYNGANDDAAGITGVIMLAKYFKALNNNQRTIIFVAFTAEESGGYGSQHFSRTLDAAKVAAMFNIEMIGTESKWGKNSAYITGYEKTDMGQILQKNLSGSDFRFYPDPYTEEQLFYRSDNATLARLGVPAHTISTSKMDAEPNYHKPSDEIGTLDLGNMTEIIKSIAVSATSIIAGKDSPSRVKTSDLER